jgi:hypothetical protein
MSIGTEIDAARQRIHLKYIFKSKTVCSHPDIQLENERKKSGAGVYSVFQIPTPDSCLLTSCF